VTSLYLWELDYRFTMQRPRFSSVVVNMQFMWAELCQLFLLVTTPPELRTFIITYGTIDRPIQLVSYHSFYTYFLAFLLTGISLQFTYLC
jgi:hypothetical protein